MLQPLFALLAACAADPGGRGKDPAVGPKDGVPEETGTPATTDTGTTCGGTGPSTINVQLLLEADTPLEYGGHLQYVLTVTVDDVLVEGGLRYEPSFTVTVPPGEVLIRITEGQYEDSVTAYSTGYTGLNGSCYRDCSAHWEDELCPGVELDLMLPLDCRYTYGCD